MTLRGECVSIYSLIRPLVFRLDAERAHRATVNLLKLRTGTAFPPEPPDTPELASRVARLRFPNPVGLAAGFDKDAEVARADARRRLRLRRGRHGHPAAAAGNPKPRLFRLVEDRGGDQPHGVQQSRPRSPRWNGSAEPRTLGGIVGINIGANKDSADRIADYVAGVADGGAARLYHDQHQLAQHARPARPAGRRCARRAAGGRAAEARGGRPAHLSEGRARSRARPIRTDRRAAIDHGSTR